MKIKVIEKKDVRNLLKEAAAARNVYTPRKHIGGDVWIEQLPKEKAALEKVMDDVVLGGADTLLSSKDLFFPQLESIFEFKKDDKIQETIESSPKLLFGIAACDLQGMLFSDDFYKRNFEDIYYLNRIRNRFVIVISCLTPPRPTCFCTSTKCGPFATKGYDLQFFEHENAYFVETGSAEGETFLSEFKKYFKDAQNNSGALIATIKSKACGAIELKVDFQKALDLMAKDDFVPEENYKRIGERCIYCGGCLYVCPTCTCFNVFDNTKDDGTGTRLRNWDACVFEGYTRETSGHNPRKEKWLRTSRRYEHKLKYDYKATGMSGCVGCGRCLASCPVDIGISKFIQEITEEKRVM